MKQVIPSQFQGEGSKLCEAAIRASKMLYNKVSYPELYFKARDLNGAKQKHHEAVI